MKAFDEYNSELAKPKTNSSNSLDTVTATTLNSNQSTDLKLALMQNNLTPAEFEDLQKQFNLSQAKKDMLRADMCSGLLDSMLEELHGRITLESESISTDELIKGIKVIRDQLTADRSSANSDNSNSIPLIQINQQNNINDSDGTSNLSRESRNKIQDMIQSLLNENTK